MKMLLTRRMMLASLGAAASLSAVAPRIRAGCLVAPGDFDGLLVSLREMQGLGYSGFSTTMRVMRTGRLDEMRGQLSEFAMDLVGVRSTLPKYVDLGLDRALEEVSRLAMAARQFGSRTLVLHSTGLAADGKFKPQDLEVKAKFFDLAAKRCKDTGVIFTYRTQEAEFAGEAAEINGLIAKTDKNITYYHLDLARAARVYPEAIGVFRDNPSRTFSMEAPFGDAAFKIHDLAAAIKHTKWISWLIESTPTEVSRGSMKKIFGI